MSWALLRLDLKLSSSKQYQTKSDQIVHQSRSIHAIAPLADCVCILHKHIKRTNAEYEKEEETSDANLYIHAVQSVYMYMET